jgi:hypothetical protein
MVVGGVQSGDQKMDCQMELNPATVASEFQESEW